MNAGLRYLLWTEPRGQLRSLRRRLRGWKGALVIGGASLLLLLLVAPRILVRLSPVASAPMAAGPDALREGLPLALLGLALLAGISGRGLFFRPAEVQLLLPSPVSRLELVLFNVLARGRIAVLSALWLGLLLELGTPSALATMAGLLLSLLFVQIGAQCWAVSSAWLGERLPTWRRRALLAGVLALPIASALHEASRSSAAGPNELAQALVGAPVMRGLSRLALPFAEVLIAPSFAAALPWIAVSLAVLAAGVAWMAHLDVAFCDAAFARSHELQRRLARMRGGGGVFASGPGHARIRLPAFPRLGGAGPIAWRQALELVRNLRGVAAMLLVVGLTAGSAIFVPTLSLDPEVRDEVGGAFAQMAIALVIFVSLALTQHFAFDFRRDLDRMPALKTLPVSSGSLAAGQLAAGASFMAVVQLVAIGAITLATGALDAGAYLACVALLPPLSWAALAVDNAIFLVWPYRLVPEDPGDVGFMGRIALAMLAKFSALAALGLAASLAGWSAAWLADGSRAAATLAASALLVAACVPLTALVAWSFERFDVARDVPA